MPLHTDSVVLALRTGLNGHARDALRAARGLTILAVGVWLAAALAAGALGLVNQPGQPPLVLAGFLAIPIAGFLLADAASPAFRAFTETIPLGLLVGSHLWRFVGLGFVIAWLWGVLPAGFGIPEGTGDIIAAAGALALLRPIREGAVSRRWLLAWNVFGFVDLLSALTMGLLFSESAIGVLHTPTSNTTLMVAFPVSLIPTFLVPLFLLSHALIFRRVGRVEAAQRSMSAR
jgi:hypothetical protein